MNTRPAAVSPRAAVAVGLLGLASAMGIGRFAFTPLLPLMQHDAGLTLAQGGALAAANYLGYLAGALGCVWLRSSAAALARVGLLAVAVATLAMGGTDSFAAWWWWRTAAGVASALVLVGVSAWSLAALAQAGASSSAGGVFAGVGVGIVAAGGVALATSVSRQSPSSAWVALGIGAALIAALVWRPLGAPVPAAATVPGTAAARRFDAAAWRLIACYGVVGFGYILPATFLPAVARERFPDPAQYGWSWPLFGAAAAASTIIASRLFGASDSRRVWAVGQLVMALGVVAPALSRSGTALLLAAVCVGGSFMVVTMAAMQLARAVGATSAARLIAAMTAAFAAGQLLGPLAVSAAAALGASPLAPYPFAALLLALAVALLHAGRPARAAPTPNERTSP
jgi:hypothetical protein